MSIIHVDIQDVHQLLLVYTVEVTVFSPIFMIFCKNVNLYQILVKFETRSCGVITRSLAGLEKSSVLPVLDRFLKLKTDLFLDKKLKNRSIKPCISQDFAIHRLTLSPVRIVHY